MVKTLEIFSWILLIASVLSIVLGFKRMFFSVKFRQFSVIVFGLSALCNLVLFFYVWDFFLLGIAIICIYFCLNEVGMLRRLTSHKL